MRRRLVFGRDQLELTNEQPDRAGVVCVVHLADAFGEEILAGESRPDLVQQCVVSRRNRLTDSHRLHRLKVDVHLLKPLAQRCHARRIALVAAPVTVLSLALALPVQAGAHKAHRALQDPTTDPVTLALERAEAYWKSSPCGGAVAVAGEPATAFPLALENGIVARASFNTPGGADMLSEPPATYTDCVVHYDLKVWPSWRPIDASFPAFCQVMTHELGHFEGIGDPGTPGTVTQTEALRAPIVAPCRHAVLWYGHERIIG